MNELKNLIRNLENIEKNSIRYFTKIIRENISELDKLIINRLEQGVDYNGQFIQRKQDRITQLNSAKTYTRQYSRFKSRKGGRIDVVDLKLTGDFHKSIKSKNIGSLNYELDSSDFKKDFLKKQYGVEILGYGEKEVEKFTEKIIIPMLNQFIENRLLRK